MIKFYSGGVKRRKIVGKTAKIQVDRISGKTHQFSRKKPEMRDTRGDFISIFNTFNRNLKKMA